MKNETPFHVMAHAALPLALPQMRLEHVEYTGLVEKKYPAVAVNYSSVATPARYSSTLMNTSSW